MSAGVSLRPAAAAGVAVRAGEVSEADAAFQTARPRLFAIAHRVLGSASEADDVVQETWIRWRRSDRSRVSDAAAFLATTTTRLALNVLQSARARRETCATPSLPGRVDPSADPALVAERREALALALRVLLERLSPTERAAYLLRESFDYPHRQIAQVLGLSEANARQRVARARLHLAREPGRHAGTAELGRLVEAFARAAETGELAPLERLLSEEARVRTRACGVAA